MWASPDYYYYRTHGYYFGAPKSFSTTPKTFGIDSLKRKAALRGGKKRK